MTLQGLCAKEDYLAMIMISLTYGTFASRQPMKNFRVPYHHIFQYFFRWHLTIYLRILWNGISIYNSDCCGKK
jgi:hypothetical protein